MPDFSAKMHQIQFQLGLRCAQDPTGESSSWLGGDWLPPLQEHTHALGSIQFFPRPTILPLNLKVKLLCAQGRHVILSWIGTPHFLDQRYAPGFLERTISLALVLRVYNINFITVGNFELYMIMDRSFLRRSNFNWNWHRPAYNEIL